MFQRASPTDGRTAGFTVEQPDGIAYLILDSETFGYPPYEYFEQRLIDGWDTVEEMEAGIGLPDGEDPVLTVKQPTTFTRKLTWHDTSVPAVAQARKRQPIPVDNVPDLLRPVDVFFVQSLARAVPRRSQ